MLKMDEGLFDKNQAEQKSKAEKMLEVEYVNVDSTLNLDGPPSPFFVHRGRVFRAKPLDFQRGLRLQVAFSEYVKLAKVDITKLEEKELKLYQERIANKVYKELVSLANELLECDSWLERKIWGISKRSFFDDASEAELGRIAVFFYNLRTR